jgi:hypothetical protein
MVTMMCMGRIEILLEPKSIVSLLMAWWALKLLVEWPI